MVQVIVHHNDVEQALRLLRKKLQREGITKKSKIIYYEKPSVKRARKIAEAKRRIRRANSKRT